METMSGAKIDVLWSPIHHDKFIVWGPDITLYEVSLLKDIEKKTTFTQISSTRGATVVASQSANGVRCVDISAIAEQPDPLLALGHSSGKITLNSLMQTYDPLGLVGKELTPRYPRPCNAVAWNHSETNLLLTAMDKHRNDYCIQLWDMHVAGDEIFEGSPPAEPSRPMQELGMAEAAHSVAWCSFANRTFIASMNLKHLKLYDLRESTEKACGVATSRQWAGACAEAGGGWLVASRGDSALCVWDARRLAAPLRTLPQPRPLRKIQWCPTRRNLLMSLQRDSCTLRLHDIQQATEYKAAQSFDSNVSATPALEEGGLEEGGGVLEREVAAAAQPLAAFCWHPAHGARLLAVGLSGSMTESTVCERVTLAWGAGPLAWAGGGTLRALRPHALARVPDIAQKMRARAATEYGLKPDLWQNADLADDEALSGLWHFLALSKSLVEDGCIRNSGCKHPGVRTVLRAAGEGGWRSEAVASLMPDVPSRKVTVYRSAERARALQLCGWGWGWDGAAAAVERAEAEGTPCRAAALAAFHLRARHALDVLARARDPRLRVAALALAPPAAPAPPSGPAGASADERLWRDALAAAAPALPDAYLRAVLHFLAAAAAPQPQPDFALVLNETEMRLEDRVAFACMFLSDAKLHEYVRHTSDALLERGDLSAILFTGMSAEGLSVLQRWVERTGDVQSAALLAARCCPPDLLRDPRPAHWLDRCLPVRAGPVARVGGALRAGHVGVRGAGRGGRGGAARGRGVRVLRQVRGARRAPAPRARAPAAARRQDEADLVVPELPQAAAALRGVLAAPGRGRGGGGRRGGRGGLRRLVQLVRGLPPRGPRRASTALVQRAHGVPGELVQLPLQRAGPARPRPRLRPAALAYTLVHLVRLDTPRHASTRLDTPRHALYASTRFFLVACVTGHTTYLKNLFVGMWKKLLNT